jgi:hypothetical protein
MPIEKSLTLLIEGPTTFNDCDNCGSVLLVTNHKDVQWLDNWFRSHQPHKWCNNVDARPTSLLKLKQSSSLSLLNTLFISPLLNKLMFIGYVINEILYCVLIYLNFYIFKIFSLRRSSFIVLKERDCAK